MTKNHFYSFPPNTCAMPGGKKSPKKSDLVSDENFNPLFTEDFMETTPYAWRSCLNSFMSSLDRFPTESPFEAKVLTDIIAFLLSNTGKSVLLFPPLNSYRRFLIHSLLEKYVPSYGLSTFSVGKDERRRVVLFKIDQNVKFDPQLALPSILDYSTTPLSELFSNISTSENLNSGSVFQLAEKPKRKKSLDLEKTENSLTSKLTGINLNMNDTENKKQAVSSKRRAVESYYVPPPLRKLNPKNEESLKERVRPVKQKVKTTDTTKACNDSSLLFQEDEVNQTFSWSQNKVKPKSVKPIQQKPNASNVYSDSEQAETVETRQPKEELPKEVSNVVTKEVVKPQESLETVEDTAKSQKNETTVEITVKPKEIDTVSDKAPKAPKPLPNVVLTLGDYHETVHEPAVEKSEKPPPIKETVKPKKKSAPVESTPPLIPKTSKPPKNLFTEVDDWESLYDLADDSLTYEELEEISNRVGKMNILHANENYSDFSDPSTQEVGTIIEIYGFREEIKTGDLIAIFGSYTSRGFNLKWVDDTHALGIFSSSRLAEEVLNTDLPMVKTRPLHRASPQSRSKAKSLVLPSTLRPKTCTSLARRLVSGALGVKVTVTPEKMAAEKELLREAREVKRRAAKDRDAAWEGFTSSQ